MPEIQSLNQCALEADGLGSFNLPGSINPIDPKPICPLDSCPSYGVE